MDKFCSDNTTGLPRRLFKNDLNKSVTPQLIRKQQIGNCQDYSSLINNDTKAHGLPNTVTDPTLSGRILWRLMTMTAVMVFLYHSSVLLTQLKAEQVSIAINFKSVPFQQPDILVCLKKPFAIDYLQNPPAKDYDLMKKVEKTINAIDNLVSALDPEIIQVLNNDASLLLWNSINLKELYRAFFYRESELFLSIICNSRDNVSLSVEMNWKYLACWRVTPIHCHLQNPWSTIRFVMYIHTHNLNIRYPRQFNITFSSTPIEMYKFQEPNNYDVTDSVEIFFLPRQGNIMIDSETVSLIGGKSTHIKITSTIFKHQNRTIYQCAEEKTNYTVYDLLESDKTLVFNDTSTCMFLRSQRIFYNRFNCVVANYPIPIDIPRNVTFCFNISSNTMRLAEFAKLYLSLSIQTEAMTKCMQEFPCTTVAYATKANYMNWPLKMVMLKYVDEIMPAKIRRDNLTGDTNPGLVELTQNINGVSSSVLDLWRQNLYDVTIRPGEYNSTQFVESISYTLTSFLTDTGGIMGFYMGVSVLTLCEIFGLIHKGIFLAYMSRRLKDTDHK